MPSSCGRGFSSPHFLLSQGFIPLVPQDMPTTIPAASSQQQQQHQHAPDQGFHLDGIWLLQVCSWDSQPEIQEGVIALQPGSAWMCL